MQTNRTRKLLAEGKAARGAWATLGSPISLEIIAGLDFDWVLLDFEHGAANYDQCANLLRALSGSPITSFARVPSATDPGVFKRVLDAGVEGVLVPMVRSAAEVDRLTRDCRYPPRGTRGIATGRAHQHGLDRGDYFKRANDELLVMVQIETKEALDDLEAIAAVEDLDGMFVGPADLSAALGTPFNTKSDVFETAAARILEVCKASGKYPGIYCSTPEDVARRQAQGFLFTNVCNDQSLLVKALMNAAKAPQEKRR